MIGRFNPNKKMGRMDGLDELDKNGLGDSRQK
jgi:hypothetical protein